MTAVLSCTYDDLYLFNLPFAVYSWHKIGVSCIVFIPSQKGTQALKAVYVVGTIIKMCPCVDFHFFDCPVDKQATYAQCSRLYGAALDDVAMEETLITADADMCVFDRKYWQGYNGYPGVTVIGRDLTPERQYPMCYISMDATTWREVMEIRLRSYQQCLDDLLADIECENFRGNYWGKDQETIHDAIWRVPTPQYLHFVDRAAPGTQFATRRADRDGWVVSPDIIDAHLPRPGYTEENFLRIRNLFHTMYPEADHSWMTEYRNEYVKLMEG